MSICFTCSQCGKRYKVKDGHAGRRVKCKACGTPIQIPVQPRTVGDQEEVSEAGTAIKRYTARERSSEPAFGGEDLEAISNHIEKHVGKIATVYHELISDLVHVDVHIVEPTDDKPYYTLVTSGMSDKPMQAQEGAEDCRHAELLISLPATWQMSEEALKDKHNYWPIRWLKMLARFPHEFDTWIWYGHTLPNGERAEPYADNTKLCCALLLQPALAPEEFSELKVSEEKTIYFLSFVPIYAEEMTFKLKNGLDPLLQRFAQHEINEVLDIGRTNVCKKLWPFK